MEKLDKKIRDINYRVSIFDSGLHDKIVLELLSQNDIIHIKYIIPKLENKCNMLRKQYKNLNVIRLNLLGLI